MPRHLLARISANIWNIVRKFMGVRRDAIGGAAPQIKKLSPPQMRGPQDRRSDQEETVAPGQDESGQCRIIFDISDLIQFLRESRVPTGIQRVQLNIIHYAMMESTLMVPPIIVYFDVKRNDWLHLTRAEFLELYRATEVNDAIDEEKFLVIMDGLAERESLITHLASYPRQDQFILVNLGTSWWIERYFLKIRELRNHCALCYVPMIHDCIPLKVPEHCGEALVEEFRNWFAGVCLEADAVLTNSRWSMQDIHDEMTRRDPMICLPIYPVALNGDMSRHLTKRSLIAENPLRHILSDGAAFVLYVATLESRKNHLLLFKAWHKLIENHGVDAVPHLLCLGRAGWRFEGAAEYLRAHPILHERIILISSVPDAALATFYRHCLFSVFNSLYEGWGLPITESLSFGALPLVASNTSLIEAGGDSAVYFNANDLSDLYQKLEMLIFDASRREGLRKHAQASAQIREWSAVADEMLQKLHETTPIALERQRRFLDISPGNIISLGKADADVSFHHAALTSLLREGLNWHRPEEWGCWTMPGVASIRLMLPDELLRKDTALFIRFRGAAFKTTVKISIFGDGDMLLHGPMERMIGAGVRLVLCFTMVPAGKALRLEIDCGAGSSLGPNDRDVGVGLTHLMVCASADAAARGAFKASFPELHQASWMKRRRAFQQFDVPNRGRKMLTVRAMPLQNIKKSEPTAGKAT